MIKFEKCKSDPTKNEKGVPSLLILNILSTKEVKTLRSSYGGNQSNGISFLKSVHIKIGRTAFAVEGND